MVLCYGCPKTTNTFFTFFGHMCEWTSCNYKVLLTVFLLPRRLTFKIEINLLPWVSWHITAPSWPHIFSLGDSAHLTPLLGTVQRRLRGLQYGRNKVQWLFQSWDSFIATLHQNFLGPWVYLGAEGSGGPPEEPEVPEVVLTTGRCSWMEFLTPACFRSF